MNFGELKTYLKSLINRKDLSDAIAGQFITQAQTRLERTQRPAFMQKMADANPSSSGIYPLPDDFLEMIDLYSGCRTVERVAVQTYLSTTTGVGSPCVFVQMGNDCRVRPIPEDPGTLTLHYYAKEPTLTVDTATNAWTDDYSDALTFGAAIFAAHHFEDERLEGFTQQHDILAAEITDRALREDFSGPMRIAPSVPWPSDD